MAAANFTQLVLNCASWQEAQRIADVLLEKRLVACVEFLEVKSKFHWQGHLDEAKEVKLIMESLAEHFEKIESEVTKLHSYETFVLQQIPLSNLSQDASIWLNQEVNQLTDRIK